MASCSVIIVTYQTGAVLFAALKSILKQDGLAELIVVDNGNPPDTLTRLQQMALTQPRLKIVTGHGNVGIAKACNLGAKQASGDFLLFLHPDCLMPPQALIRCMAGFDEVPDAMLAGCFLMNSDGSKQDYRFSITQIKSRLLALVRKAQVTPESPEQTHEVESVLPAFMAIKAADFHKLEGFDERFFLQMADVDLCRRVRLAGGKLICIPEIKVTHLHTSSRRSASGDLEWYKAKGCMHYVEKHFKDKWFPGSTWVARMGILAGYVCAVAFEDVLRWCKGKPDQYKTLAYKRLMILASGLAELSETKDLAGKTILVTGATSDIGLCVMRRLIASGASVLALSRGDAIPFAHEQLRWIKDDLDNKDCNLHGYYADMAVHCAPLWYLPAAIPMLQGAGVKRIVAFSSTALFTKTTVTNRYEKDRAEKYRQAEFETEDACRQKNIEWTILRPTLVYGVGLDKTVTQAYQWIRTLGMFPMYPPALGRSHPVHVDDLALAAMQCLNTTATSGHHYNLSGGEIITYKEMLERLFKLSGKRVWLVPAPWLPFVLELWGLFSKRHHINAENAYRMNEDMVFFHDAAKKDFGFLPRSFLSGGIRDMEGF